MSSFHIHVKLFNTLGVRKLNSEIQTYREISRYILAITHLHGCNKSYTRGSNYHWYRWGHGHV